MSKQLPNCQNIAETRVVTIICNGVLCDVSAYTVTSAVIVALHESCI